MHDDDIDEAQRARTYRARASEIRAIAATVQGADARATLLSTAQDYEHMALAIERRSATRSGSKDNGCAKDG